MNAIRRVDLQFLSAGAIKEPYEQQLTWVTPEGGSGPNYQGL
jgi:hypothetical protein